MADDKKNEDYTIELGEQKPNGAFDAAPPPRMPVAPTPAGANSPVVAILSYCGSSILMTTTNKYVLSGLDFNLKEQSVVCIIAIQSCKSAGVITYRDFKSDEAKKCMFSPNPPTIVLQSP